MNYVKIFICLGIKLGIKILKTPNNTVNFKPATNNPAYVCQDTGAFIIKNTNDPTVILCSFASILSVAKYLIECYLQTHIKLQSTVHVVWCLSFPHL